MPLRPSRSIQFFSVLTIVAAFASVSAITLEDLRSQRDLTPYEFASHFKGFQYAFRKSVQPPKVFLASKSGDCDDYSTLAAAVLREKGYTPRLIAVRMPGVVHVVCYIEEVNGYLDYNNRNSAETLVSCANDLAAIAQSVGISYQLNWTSVSEFTFAGGAKRLVQTVLESKKEARSFAGLFR